MFDWNKSGCLWASVYTWFFFLHRFNKYALGFISDFLFRVKTCKRIFIFNHFWWVLIQIHLWFIHFSEKHVLLGSNILYCSCSIHWLYQRIISINSGYGIPNASDPWWRQWWARRWEETWVGTDWTTHGLFYFWALLQK